MSRIAILRSILSPLQPGKFLDLGAGHGKFALAARDLGWDVTAVDARNARMPVEEEGVEWVVSDVREFPFESEDYDCVSILGLFYHLDFQSQMEVLRRSSGALTILDTFVVAFAEDEEGGYPGAYYVETGDTEERRNTITQASWGNARSFWPTEESLIRMLREAGFSLVAPVQPGHRRDRTFYVCYPPESRSVGVQQPQLGELKSQLVEGRQSAQQLENENRRLRGRVQKLEGQLQEIHDSNSWKVARTLSSVRAGVSSKATALLERVRSRS